jgi:hypothetical protein
MGYVLCCFVSFTVSHLFFRSLHLPSRWNKILQILESIAPVVDEQRPWTGRHWSWLDWKQGKLYFTSCVSRRRHVWCWIAKKFKSYRRICMTFIHLFEKERERQTACNMGIAVYNKYGLLLKRIVQHFMCVQNICPMPLLLLQRAGDKHTSS